MSEALFGGLPFRLDPESVTVGFRVKTAAMETQGGRVVQILGTTCDTLTVVGSFGRGGVDEQRAFLDRMTQLADAQASFGPGQQNRFYWPQRGWDFTVILTEYSNPDGPMSVRVAPALSNPRWLLGLYVTDDNGTIKQAPGGADAFINRLAAGIGWKQTQFNGPMPDWPASLGVPGVVSNVNPGENVVAPFGFPGG